MATNRRNNDSVRFRYGMCLNEKCEKAKSKEIQRLSARKDFVCEECGSPLREVPNSTGGGKKKWIYIACAIGVIAIAVIIFILANLSNKETEIEVNTPQVTEQPVDSTAVDSSKINQDSIAVDTPAVKVTPTPDNGKTDTGKDAKTGGTEVEKPKPVTNSSATHGTVNLGYGSYTGDLKNGKPHGYGKITYTQRHKIASSQSYVAEPGDTFEGDFRDGIPSGGTGYWNHQGDMKRITL